MVEEKRKSIGLNDAEFKRHFGVKRETYAKMLSILQAAYVELHRLGGKPPKLSVQDKLEIALQYVREYRTMDNIGYDWGVCKSAVSNSIRWVEDTLIREGTFKLPGKKALRKKTVKISYLVVDCTESPVQRPKKQQRRYYSGKKNAIPLKRRS
jgi:hypothetical protein